jgi:hypothetical protein
LVTSCKNNGFSWDIDGYDFNGEVREDEYTHTIAEGSGLDIYAKKVQPLSSDCPLEV